MWKHYGNAQKGEPQKKRQEGLSEEESLQINLKKRNHSSEEWVKICKMSVEKLQNIIYEYQKAE